MRYALSTPADTPAATILIRRKDTADYAVEFVPASVQTVAKNTRSLPDAFLNPARPDVTDAFVRFAAPLVGPLPPAALL